ncbi:MAG: MFS transporter [Chloroflexi bacterium]|nr:MFS transporter [Chloroflexota bacterium]
MVTVLPSTKNSSAQGEANAYPWVVAGLAAMLLFTANASTGTFGVFFKPIAEQFDWSRGIVSIAIVIRSLAIAILVMPAGHLYDRYGPRGVILPCFLLLAIGFLLTSKVATVWHFYLAQGLIMGAGTADPFVCLVSTIAKWHDRRRGLALGIASAGVGLGTVFFSPLAASLIVTRGWEQASVVLGLLTLVIAVPASLFVKDPPLVRNQSDETTSAEEMGSRRRGRNKGVFDVIRSLPHLLQNRQFSSLFAVFALFYVGIYLVINHLVNYVTDTGMGTLVAATMMSVAGIASIAGRLVMGPISDRISTRADAATCCSLVIIALVLLPLKVEPLMWVAAALFGVGWGGASPLIPAITADYFGTNDLATKTGAFIVAANLGSAAGPWMGGFLFDLTNGYLWSLLLSAVMTTVGLVIVLRLSSPTREVD